MSAKNDLIKEQCPICKKYGKDVHVAPLYVHLCGGHHFSDLAAYIIEQEKRLAELREKIEKLRPKYHEKCNCQRCHAYDSAIDDVLGLLSSEVKSQ